MRMPKNFLQGAAKVLSRNLNSNSAAAEIVTMIEKVGAKVTDSCITSNKETKRLAGLVKAFLIGSNTLSK